MCIPLMSLGGLMAQEFFDRRKINPSHNKM